MYKEPLSGRAADAGGKSENSVIDCHRYITPDIVTHAAVVVDIIQKLLERYRIGEIIDGEQIVVREESCRKYLIYADHVRCIEIDVRVRVEKNVIFKIVQRAEHGAALHVVTIDDRVRVGKISAVCGPHIGTSRKSRIPVHIMIQVVVILNRMPRDRIIDVGIVDQDPGNEVRINFIQHIEIDASVKTGKNIRRKRGFLTFTFTSELDGLNILDGQDRFIGP